MPEERIVELTAYVYSISYYDANAFYRRRCPCKEWLASVRKRHAFSVWHACGRKTKCSWAVGSPILLLGKLPR
jgi:hypothetical protein